MTRERSLGRRTLCAILALLVCAPGCTTTYIFDPVKVPLTHDGRLIVRYPDLPHVPYREFEAKHVWVRRASKWDRPTAPTRAELEALVTGAPVGLVTAEIEVDATPHVFDSYSLAAVGSAMTIGVLMGATAGRTSEDGNFFDDAPSQALFTGVLAISGLIWGTIYGGLFAPDVIDTRFEVKP